MRTKDLETEIAKHIANAKLVLDVRMSETSLSEGALLTIQDSLLEALVATRNLSRLIRQERSIACEN